MCLAGFGGFRAAQALNWRLIDDALQNRTTNQTRTVIARIQSDNTNRRCLRPRAICASVVAGGALSKCCLRFSARATMSEKRRQKLLGGVVLERRMRITDGIHDALY